MGTDRTWKRKVGQNRNEGSLTSWWRSYQPRAEMLFTYHVCGCERSGLMGGEGGIGSFFVQVSICVFVFQPCPPFIISRCFLFPSPINCFSPLLLLVSAVFEPFCPSICWTAMSQKAAHPPSRFSIKRTWKRTTESIKWCENGHMGSQNYLSWAKNPYKWWKGFYICALCVMRWTWAMQLSTHDSAMFSSASHFYCSLHFNQGFHMIPTSSHPAPLQSVLLPVTLILLWRLLAG